MRIALIQTNPLIGDFAGNVANMAAWLAQAKAAGCGLAVFPELAICGYPPQDLLERPAFLDAHDRALTRFIDETRGIGVVCGVIERRTEPAGKPLANSAILFAEGQVLRRARKQLLPSYDIFDEARYFEPGGACVPLRFGGVDLLLTVCEDIWNDKAVAGRQLYPVDPLERLFAGDGPHPRLVVNIAASPYHMGKRAVKHDIFRNLCRRYGVHLLYTNQVGGQDAFLFDGESLAMDAGGRITARGRRFAEDMVVVEVEEGVLRSDGALPPQEAPEDEVADVLDALTMGIRDYTRKCGFSRAVVGLSGGIDSALTAAVAARALGAANVLGVAMPSPYSSAESVEDARQLAANLGIGFELIPITGVFEAELATLAPILNGWPADVTEQNLQARTRGTILMAISNKQHRILLSTGNKSELAVGYCTLYGDMNGGLAVIADVPKGLVYRLARFINRDGERIPLRSIEKPPSAELAPNQKDQDDLPPYEVLDGILIAYLEENRGIEEIVAMGYPRQTVADIIRRIRINEYKRKQAPMGLKVTSKAFGYGRRYPSAEGFREELGALASAGVFTLPFPGKSVE